MTIETFIPPVAPSPGSSRRPELKLLKADFGDGYGQVAPDGLNHIRQTFSLKWDVLTYGQAATITAFLERQGGATPFLYQHPNTAVPLKVTCEEWSQSDAAAGLCSLAATFKQSFNQGS